MQQNLDPRLPKFPEFKILDLEDNKTITPFVSQFPPYSDFGFVNLWVYNMGGKISNLNGNLVIHFHEYEGDDFFYTFIGNKELRSTVETLLEKTERLKLIPEFVVNDEIKRLFNVTEDRDNFDYIVSLEELSRLEGNKFQRKRNQIHQFNRLFPESVCKIVDLKNEKVQEDFFKVYEEWKIHKTSVNNNEFVALQRILDLNDPSLTAFGTYYKDQMIAFFISQLLPSFYVDGHFGKHDPSFKAANDFHYHETSKLLFNLGYRYLNLEQDLGILSLRSGKERWYPIKFLKKYQISKRE